MSLGGWIFMVFSWAWILGVLFWSFRRLMREESPEPRTDTHKDF